MSRWGCRLLGALVALAPVTGGVQAQGRSDGHLLSVRVTSGDGTPRAAQVQLRWRAHPELPGCFGLSLGDHGVCRASFETNADGELRVPLPNRGPFVVLAVAESSCSAEHFPVMAGDSLALRLRPAGRLEGQLLHAESGEPIAGAPIHTMPDRMSWLRLGAYRWPEPRITASSDAEGRFWVPARTIITHRPLWPDFEPFDVVPYVASQELVVIDPEPLPAGGPTTIYRVVAGPAERPSVRVVDVWDKPLSGVELRDWWSGEVVGKTDAHGGVPECFPPLGFVEVNEPGRERRRIRRGSAGPGKQESIVVHPGRVVRATLVDSTGKPLANRRVLWTMQTVPPAFEWLRTTDEQGVTEFDQAVRLIDLTGYVEVEGKFVPFYHGNSPKEEKDLGVVEVAAPRSLRGLVVGADGGPAPHARLALFNVGRDFTTRPCVTYADRSGRFEFASVPAGKSRITVEAGAAGMHCVEPGVGVRELRIEIPRGVAVQGVVLRPSGAVVVGAQVVLQQQRTPSSEHLMPGPHRSLASLCALTRSGGEFRFLGVPKGGPWQLRCQIREDGEVYEGTTTVEGAGERGLVLRLRRVDR